MQRLLALSLAASLLAGVGALAQTGHQGHGVKGSAKETPASKAYREANDKMHAGMNIRLSNDADVDFIRGMIPHHQAAIEMAQIVLKYGKDEVIRKLANAIIREQRREIAEMQEWLKTKGW